MSTIVKLADILVMNKKYSIANRILKYFQSLNSDNREVCKKFANPPLFRIFKNIYSFSSV
jgi:hypothetical protein